MRVLLVEPDKSVAGSIKLMLTTEGFNVFVADAGEEAIDLGKLYDYDAIVTETRLVDDIDGLGVIRTLRRARIKTPVIVLSRDAGIEDKVNAFSVGADDYLVKPFHRDELVARLHAVVRRTKGHAQSVISGDGLDIDLDAQTVALDGQSIRVTHKEYAILELLALRRDTVVSREMFLNHLYGGLDEPDMKTLDVFMCKVRRKLAAASPRQMIECVWGRGYMLRSLAGAKSAA